MFNKQLFRRKVAGVLAAVLVVSAVPGNMTAAAQPRINASEVQENVNPMIKTATESNAAAELSTPSLAKAEEEGITYYVDAENGDDDADGKSEETAWKTFDRVNSKIFLPGDKILLMAGCVWNEPLNPKGSGQEGAPIIIDKYGDGARPIINGNGTSGPSITGAVTIYNEEFWEIYNLEVTNLENTDQPGEVMDSGTSERAGILIYSSNQKKIYEHIVVKNCYVHDVNSSYKGGKTSGGIIVIGHYLDKDGKRVTIDANGKLTAKAMGRAAFKDVLIEGNYVKNVAIEGIRNKCNTDISGSGWGRNEFLKNYSDVTIRNNYIQDVVGDGIVLTETRGGLVEGNMVNASCGFNRGHAVYAQCWTMFSDNVTVQYNEAYGNRYGDNDGEAFDSDFKNINNVFQYNLSHDCGGGLCLFMGNQENTIFRYNVSINDGTGTYPNETLRKQQLFHLNASMQGKNMPEIYNNTIVMFGEGKETSLFGATGSRTLHLKFKNNIVLEADGARIHFAEPNYTTTVADDSIIENNLFWPERIITEDQNQDKEIMQLENLRAKGNVFADPMLEDYKAGKDYSKYVYPLEDLDELGDSEFTKELIRERVKPYRLTEGSPAIEAGQRIDGMPSEDIMGNTVAGKVDIGALEYSNTDETAETVQEVELVTMIRILPVMPSELQVTVDGEDCMYPVEWDEILPEDVAEAGTITVAGKIAGLSNEIEATVFIVDRDSVESYEPIRLVSYAGFYPELPEQATVYFDNGIEMSLDVKWDEIAAELYTREGTFTADGVVADLADTVQAEITVEGRVGDEAKEEKARSSKDTYNVKGKPSENYGSEHVIKIKNSRNEDYYRHSLIGFDLSEQQEMLQEATNISLQLEMLRPRTEEDFNKIHEYFYLRVYSLSTDSNAQWQENTVTWDSEPQPENGTLVVDDKQIYYKNIRDEHDWIVSLDVTEWVKNEYMKSGRTSFSFLMRIDELGSQVNGDEGGVDFASRENLNYMPPMLVLNNVYATKVQAEAVSTAIGKKPVLPEKISVNYSDGQTKEISVEWNNIPASAYQNEGSFTVSGRAGGVRLPIICTVNVIDSVHEIVAIEELPQIIHLTGTMWEKLDLPDTVTAILDNGQKLGIPVSWTPDVVYNPNREFSYICIGNLDLTNQPAVENPKQKYARMDLTIIAPADKAELVTLYTEAADLLMDGSVDQLTDKMKARFMKAFKTAADLLGNPKAIEEDVKAAYSALKQVIADMALEENQRPDTAELEKLVLIAESKEKDDYTTDSWEFMAAALKEAKDILRDKSLTKADQISVDEASEILSDALGELEFDGNGGTEQRLITGIEITSLPDKTEYKPGEVFTKTGLRVSAVYNDGSTKEIHNYELSEVNMKTEGEKDVTVTCRVAVNDQIKVFAESFTIVVKNAGSGSSSGSGSSTRAEAKVLGKWEKTGDAGWKFLKSNGLYASDEWAHINNKWYWFDADAQMAAGWITTGGRWYKLGADGAMLTGWLKDEADGYWYYLDHTGAMMTGWQLIMGQWYYLNPVTIGKTGWDSSGSQNSFWSYLKGKTGSRPIGSMYVNEMTPDGYLMDENGVLKK